MCGEGSGGELGSCRVTDLLSCGVIEFFPKANPSADGQQPKMY